MNINKVIQKLESKNFKVEHIGNTVIEKNEVYVGRKKWCNQIGFINVNGEAKHFTIEMFDSITFEVKRIDNVEQALELTKNMI